LNILRNAAVLFSSYITLQVYPLRNILNGYAYYPAFPATLYSQIRLIADPAIVGMPGAKVILSAA
jgi:hypothetical protein